jgi:opacity protein-like surface antigen
MKRLFFIIILLVSVSLIGFSHSYAQESSDWTGDINIYLGNKMLDKDDWSINEEGVKLELDTQRQAGLDIDFGKKSWPVYIALGYLSSSADDSISEEIAIDDMIIPVKTKMEGSTKEIRLGVKKIWEPTSAIRPYIGGGLAMINAEGKITASAEGISSGISADDQAVGFYVNGGVYWTIADHFNLGVDVGYSKAKVTFDELESDMEAGGVHYGLMLGYHW